MRNLDRKATPTPACLDSYNHGANTWDDVTHDHKEQIRACLEQMQGRRCAYCEGGIDALGEHIEHFRRKSQFHTLTFEWSNLYWSCNEKDSCGHYKDHGAGKYDVTDLIDPCAENPDTFFRFRADGTITIRTGLTVQEQHRAAETLRVFGLNEKWGRLRNMRKGAVAGYIRDVEEAIKEGFGPEDLEEYFKEALTAVVAEPFPTVIRHVLTEGP
ncbi:TIGR02646 family protein [Bradyrhizobium barranii subsp. apii]|uniref:TIGR02646 family protein n=1 Tax=Bradyrhizobium barranii subsp. apii TaxID=2819348 RepID=A0A8T5V9V0_9BRAD|nr:retron Ec78 anti-phage system effector HNH endonuclease PtuB [Bradyrhizobium barranii]UPT91408.1 TIGR02646 family protein [Bradyrhizobium barranii subsp. apii]